MKAAQFSKFGGPEVLEIVDLPEPHPGPGQVRIAVRAAGISATDPKLRAGTLTFDAELPMTTGSDVAGVVDEIGEGVTYVAVGDRVFGISDENAGAAELALLTFRAIIPASLGFVDAAGLPVALETATRALDQLGVTSGTTLLINGASGGIGSTAIQLAAARGARVIGTASAANQNYLTLLGAEPVTYEAGELRPQVGAGAGGGRGRRGYLPRRTCRWTACTSGPGSMPTSCSEPAPQRLVCGEGIRLPSGNGQRPHQQPGELLVQRVLRDQRLKLAGAGGGPASIKLPPQEGNRRVQAQLLKAAGERPGEIPGIGERRPAPQRQGLGHSPSATSRSKRSASTSSGVTASRYPAADCSTPADSPSALRARETRVCNAFATSVGGAQSQTASASAPVDTGCPPASASRAIRLRSRTPATATGAPPSSWTSSGPSIATCTALFCLGRRPPGPPCVHGGFAPMLFVAVRGKPTVHRTAPTGRAWSARCPWMPEHSARTGRPPQLIKVLPGALSDGGHQLVERHYLLRELGGILGRIRPPSFSGPNPASAHPPGTALATTW